MPDPAATFTNTFYPNSMPRQAMPAGWGSPLYLIHKDITKTLENPNSINEIIDGTETEAQYSVILNVPQGARGFIPFLVTNAVFTANTAKPSEFKVTVTNSSGNPLRYYFFGRSPLAGSGYSYNPFDAAMTNTVDPSTYGYWHGIGAWRLVTSSGGTDNFVAYPSADNSSAVASAYALGVANTAGTSRTYVSSLLSGRASGYGFETLTGITNYPVQASIGFAMSDSAGYIPLCGVDKLTCFASTGSNAPTITPGVNLDTGTLSSVNMGLAVRFVS
jgi:hypothetical protein